MKNQAVQQKNSIRVQMILIVSLVFTLLIIGTVTAGIISGYVGIRNTVNSDLVTIQQFSDHTFSVALAQAKEEAAKPAAEFDRMCVLGIDNGLKSANKMLDGGIFSECALIDTTNNIRTTYDIFDDQLKELDCVKKAAESGEIEISSTVDFNGELRFVLAAKSKMGVFVVTVNGSYFSDLIADKVIAESGNIFLIDEQGKMIANADQSIVKAQTNYIEMAQSDSSHRSAAELFGKMTSGETGVSEFRYNGVMNICAYGTVDGSDGWAYGVTAPENELLSAIVMIIAALIICSLIFLTKKMNATPRELLKEYVKSQHFTSTAEIMSAMKEMFRDVVQTALEAELDEELGRERCQRAEASSTVPNYRNGYSQKTVKTQLGEVDIKVPRDRNGSFEPKIIGKYSRNADGMEEPSAALHRPPDSFLHPVCQLEGYQASSC